MLAYKNVVILTRRPAQGGGFSMPRFFSCTPRDKMPTSSASGNSIRDHNSDHSLRVKGGLA